MRIINTLFLFISIFISVFVMAQETPEVDEYPGYFSADEFEPPVKEVADLSYQDQPGVGDFNLSDDPNEKSQDHTDFMVSTKPMIVCSPKSDAVAFKNRCEFYNNFPDAADLCTPEQEQEIRKGQAKPAYDGFSTSQ